MNTGTLLPFYHLVFQSLRTLNTKSKQNLVVGQPSQEASLESELCLNPGAFGGPGASVAVLGSELLVSIVVYRGSGAKRGCNEGVFVRRRCSVFALRSPVSRPSLWIDCWLGLKGCFDETPGNSCWTSGNCSG